jgi:hypothetical protein
MEAYQSSIEAEQAKLDRLEKILSIGEASAALYDLDGGKALNKVLYNLDEQGEDTLTLRHALRNTRGARGNEPIVMFQNPTPVKGVDGKVKRPNPMDRFRTNAKDATKSFNDAADRVSKIASSMAEDQITDHRAVNSSGELCWIKRKATAGQIDSVKKAALKSIQHQKENHIVEKSAFSVNETAMAVLKKHAALKQAALQETVASDTIKTHYTPPSTMSAQLKTWNDADRPSLGINDVDTRRALQGTDFAPKITPTVDRSYSAVTNAKKSLDKGKPDFSKSNPHETPQGEVADKYYGGNKPPVTANSATNVPGADTYKPEFQDKHAEGQWPANPANIQYPEETASSRYPDSRW